MSEKTKTIRIWLLEDHSKFAKQMCRLIDSEDDMACEKAFTHPDELNAEIEFGSKLPDLMLFDLGLPVRWRKKTTGRCMIGQLQHTDHDQREIHQRLPGKPPGLLLGSGGTLYYLTQPLLWCSAGLSQTNM